MEVDTTNITRSGSNEQAERGLGRRVSSAQSDHYAGFHRPESSPPLGPARLPSGAPHPSKSTSPAVHSRSGFNSPRMVDHYSPLSASPRAASLHKESSHESTSSSAIARDARSQTDASLSHSSYGHGISYPPSTTPPSYGSHYQAPIDFPSRRTTRDMHRLPPLTHEDTTLSSDSGQGSYTTGYTGPTLPPIDSKRILPTPVPSALATVPSPLDRAPPQLPPKAQIQQPEYRATSSLAALLRAGELARVADQGIEADADDEEMDTSGYP